MSISQNEIGQETPSPALATVLAHTNCIKILDLLNRCTGDPDASAEVGFQAEPPMDVLSLVDACKRARHASPCHK